MKKDYINIIVSSLSISLLINLIYIVIKNVLGCMNYDLAFYLSLGLSALFIFFVDFKINKKFTHSLLFFIILNSLNFLMIYILEAIPYPLSNIIFVCDLSGWFNGFAYAIYFLYNVGVSLASIILSRIIHLIINKKIGEK